MKQLLIILTFFLASVCYSQTVDEIEYFHTIKHDNDSTFRYFMSFLEEFDSIDRSRNFFCEKAAERVGDYYKFKKDYLRAIAYYDSADTKYRDRFNFCGNAYYIDYIPRRYKLSQCYWALKKQKEALSTLTPLIFDQLGEKYFDTTMTEYYLTILDSVYSKEQIINELKSSVEQANCSTTYDWSTDSSSKYQYISCKLKIFDAEFELRGFAPGTSGDQDGKTSVYTTKQVLIDQFGTLKIYRLLESKMGL